MVIVKLQRTFNVICSVHLIKNIILLEVVHVKSDGDLVVLEQHVLEHGGVAILGQMLPRVVKVSKFKMQLVACMQTIDI